MGFSRQEYWGGLPFPSSGDLSNPGIELGSPDLQVDSLSVEPPRKPNPFDFLLVPIFTLTKLFFYEHENRSC